MHASPRLAAAALVVLVALLTACGDDDAPSTPLDAGVRSDGRVEMDASRDATTTLDSGGATLIVVEPAVGHIFLESLFVRVDSASATRIDVYIDAESTPRCSDDGAPFRCLLHLDDVALGAVSVRVVAQPSGEAVTIPTTRIAVTDAPCTAWSSWGECVRTWVTAGTAAGWTGVTYENRDGDHAYLGELERFPSITGVTTDQGPTNFGTSALHMDPSQIVVGNASLAYGPMAEGWQSLPRYDAERFAASYARMYHAQKFFWYPEHRDVGGEDYFHLLAPYVGVWQGSSYEGFDELSKWMLALGAFRTDTRAALVSAGLLMPTVRMADLRARAGSDRVYLTEAAYPTATQDVATEQPMVDRINGMPADWYPPAVAMTVVEESFGPTEQPITTADAIARNWRSGDTAARRIVVDVGTTTDANGHALSFHWRVIRGDASLVRITPMADDESRVELVFQPHPERNVTFYGRDYRSSLATVGVFAFNGRYFSAPAMVSSYSATPGRWAPDSND